MLLADSVMRERLPRFGRELESAHMPPGAAQRRWLSSAPSSLRADGRSPGSGSVRRPRVGSRSLASMSSSLRLSDASTASSIVFGDDEQRHAGGGALRHPDAVGPVERLQEQAGVEGAVDVHLGLARPVQADALAQGLRGRDEDAAVASLAEPGQLAPAVRGRRRIVQRHQRP